ncbi:hypothetical protein CP02DC14_1987B, partial [Chlamydia psittaci 02DC14]
IPLQKTSARTVLVEFAK